MPAVLDGLIDPKTAAVLRTLLRHSDKLYHLHSLARASKIPVTTTSRIIKRLVDTQFATEVRVGKMSLYKLAENEKAQQVGDLL